MVQKSRLAWAEQQRGAEILAWIWLPLSFIALAVTSNIPGLHPTFHHRAMIAATFWQSTHKLAVVLLLFLSGIATSTACFVACDRPLRFAIAMIVSAVAITMLSYMNIRSAYEIAGDELRVRYAAPWTPDRIIPSSSIQHITSGCFLGGGPSSKSPTRIELNVYYSIDSDATEVLDLAGSHLPLDQLGSWLHAVILYTRGAHPGVLKTWTHDPTDTRCVAYFEEHLRGADRSELLKLLGQP